MTTAVGERRKSFLGRLGASFGAFALAIVALAPFMAYFPRELRFFNIQDLLGLTLVFLASASAVFVWRSDQTRAPTALLLAAYFALVSIVALVAFGQNWLLERIPYTSPGWLFGPLGWDGESAEQAIYFECYAEVWLSLAIFLAALIAASRWILGLLGLRRRRS